MARHTIINSTIFTEPGDVEVAATRVFDAPRELVWEAHTDPKHVPHWLLGPEGWTMPVCEIDLRPGGKWRYVWRGPQGEEFGMHGEYREVVRPERIVTTEGLDGETGEAVDTYELSEEDGKTTLSVVTAFPSREARDAALETGMKDGWAESYDRLDRYLAKLR